jgi:hypothetical protein
MAGFPCSRASCKFDAGDRDEGGCPRLSTGGSTRSARSSHMDMRSSASVTARALLQVLVRLELGYSDLPPSHQLFQLLKAEAPETLRLQK